MDYHTCRPHEALGQRCPATLYTASPRGYPASLRAWAYPAGHDVRQVVGDGYIRWRNGTVSLSGTLATPKNYRFLGQGPQGTVMVRVLSGPPVAARACIGGPDKPGRDETNSAARFA
jgi:hypothetical protein